MLRLSTIIPDRLRVLDQDRIGLRPVIRRVADGHEPAEELLRVDGGHARVREVGARDGVVLRVERELDDRADWGVDGGRVED